MQTKTPQPLTIQHLARLKMQWSSIERIPDSYAQRTRALVASLPTVALAQIVAVRVKFLQTFAFTELRKRGEVSNEDQVMHAVDVVLQKHGQDVPQMD